MTRDIITGMIGMHGSHASNYRLQTPAICSSPLAAGSPTGSPVTPAPLPSNAKMVHIDIDRAEIDKNIRHRPPHHRRCPPGAGTAQRAHLPEGLRLLRLAGGQCCPSRSRLWYDNPEKLLPHADPAHHLRPDPWGSHRRHRRGPASDVVLSSISTSTTPASC